MIGNEPNDRVVTLVNEKGWILLDDLIRTSGSSECPPLKSKTSVDQPMQIFVTSGTTGKPKIISHGHGFAYGLGFTGRYWMDLEPTDLHWTLSDNGYALMIFAGLFGPLSQGCGVFSHSMENLKARRVLETLKDFPVTSICSVPKLYRNMILEKYDLKTSPHNLRQCLSSGEPLNAIFLEKWKTMTGLDIREGYGKTESTIICGNFKGMEVKPGSFGLPCPGYEVAIVDNIGKKVPRGQQGNIAIQTGDKRPAGLFTKYLNKENDEEDMTVGDYLLTGDRGHMDEDGYIFFDSRTDDLIISGGYRIGPFEIESAIMSHPDVLESAAISSPDYRRGVVVKAFVVLKAKRRNKVEGNEAESQALATELQELCKKVNAPNSYKFPRKIEFVSLLPKTTSGKVIRYILREWEFDHR